MAAVIVLASQFVGLNWNSGRSTITLSCFSCTGTPLRNVGSDSPRGPGSVVIVTAAVCSSTSIRERTLMMPTLNGPTWVASVLTSRPNGALSYPVVRKASPVSVTGSEPSPALVVAELILLAAPQLHSMPAGGSGQGVTFFSVPAMPGG